MSSASDDHLGTDILKRFFYHSTHKALALDGGLWSPSLMFCANLILIPNYGGKQFVSYRKGVNRVLQNNTLISSTSGVDYTMTSDIQ